MKTAIIIPARYASTRLPGKPLVKIRGISMLQRVVALSQAAADGLEQVSVLVATDDNRIATHCQSLGVEVVMTPPELASGTDRVAAVVQQMQEQPDFILNMQGDAPLTPPEFLRAMITSFAHTPCDVVTPVNQLTWDELDEFREHKTQTPFSGTTAVFNEVTGEAYWFSKSILPSIRKEAELRQASAKSPVFRHLGIYGYSLAMLQTYITLPESRFEKLEGLEQLRLLENNYRIRCVPVEFNGQANISGIDSPEDITRAEAMIDKYGELLPWRGA